MMILRTRKEQYLNEIVGNGNTAPRTPYTREELFFADILGEVNAPVPVTRIEIYLAKIANKYSGEMPEPKTRIEKFIARAAGMDDVTIPTPITREEMLWANYSAVVERELSGIPPLTFTAKKTGTLKNYRIYGNTVNGENVGDLITEGEHAGEYSAPVTVTNGTDTETTNLYLPEQIKMVGDEAEYIDYGEQKQHRVRKNLLPNTATSQTISGVTFTVNSDGSVTCNGTASAITYFNLNENFNSTLYAGMKASFYQSEQQPKVNTFMIRISKANRVSTQDFTMNDQVIIDNGDSLLLAIRINSGYTCTNLTFYPMIRKADIEDDTYEPYIENTDLDVTLPALPTLSGTNMLSVGTEVQPSNVYIKYEGAR